MTKEEFLALATAGLPNFIARQEAKWFTGGMTCRVSLSNADAAGTGPKGAFRLGKIIVYPTRSLFTWCWEKGCVDQSRAKDTLQNLKRVSRGHAVSPRILPADLPQHVLREVQDASI